MSDDLEGVAYVARRGETALPVETDLASVLADLEFRQAHLAGLVSHLEVGLAGFREAVRRNQAAILRRHLGAREEAMEPCAVEERN